MSDSNDPGLNGTAAKPDDRHRNDEALRRSEERYRALVEATSQVVWSWSPEEAIGDFDRTQQWWEELTGQPVEEQRKSRTAWLDVVHPDDRAATALAWGTSLASGAKYDIECRVRERGGGWRHIHARGVPVRNPDGSVREWVGTLDDITDRRRAEAELRQSESRFRRLASAGIIGVIHWDLDRSLILDANDEFLRMTGYDRADLAAGRLNFRTMTPPEWTPRNEVGIRDLRETGVGGSYEKEYFRKDGSRVPVLIVGVRFEDTASEGMSFVTDITARKRTEGEQARLAETLSLALDAAELGTWEWDPATDQIAPSARAAEIYGLAPGRSYTREWMRGLIHPDHRDLARNEAARAVADRTEYDIEYPLARPDPVWVAARGRGVYDASGALTRMLGVVQDVTARKRAEAALRESEARHRQLADNLPSGFIYQIIHGADDNRRFSYVSAGVEALCGVTPAEVTADPMKLYGLIAEEDRARVRAAEAAALQARGTFDCQFRMRARGGELWLHCRSAPRSTPHGGAVWDGVAIDVTTNKRSETENQWLLREVESERARLADVFYHAPSFMCVLRGPDHVFERANERYLELLGARDLIGRAVRDAIPEVEGQGFFELLDRVYATGEPFVGTDVRITLRRGGRLDERVLEFVYQPMRDAAGAVSGVLAHGIDLTERKRAEEELVRVVDESERLRRKFDTALSNTADFVYLFDLDGRFTYVNKALLNLWQKDLSQALGKTFFDLGYPRDLANRLQQQIQEVIDTRQPLRDETPYTSATGTRAYEYIFVPVFGADGGVEAVAGSTRDITERKEAEQALRESDRKKDDFIAILAHELRNPLAPIRTGLQVIRLAGGEGPVARARDMMDRQLGHMVRLIDDLLDVSRIGRNKMELRRGRVTIADVIANAVETARSAIEEAGHELTIELPARPVLLDADLTRLSQVISNLLTNSAKYTERGGRVWLSAEPRAGAVVVSVRDTGTGIPADALPTVFDMFSQVDRSIERSTGGLGIGLALVKGLVEMHGGTVTAASAGQGLGSTFTVTLPSLAEEPETAPAPSAGPPAAPPMPVRRILVVDDNRDGAESLAEMLLLLGNEVHTAHDGLDAIDRAERVRPAVILMDVGMPKLNGLEATKRIREQPWGRGVTIIALTGWGQEADRERSREAGCDGHLVKPVNLSDLEKLLSELRAGGE